MIKFKEKLNQLEARAEELFGHEGAGRIMDAYAFASDAHKTCLLYTS